ncbi:unnamed protein product, partial [Polarella glacialis]
IFRFSWGFGVDCPDRPVDRGVAMVREDESKKAEQAIDKLRKLPENKLCANCLAPGMPLLTGVIMPFKIFVCGNCKSAHQSFSHRSKSTQMSVWTMDEVRSLEDKNDGGNRACQEKWLADVRDGDRPREGDRLERFKDFVQAAYIDERWKRRGGSGGGGERRQEVSRSQRPVSGERRQEDSSSQRDEGRRRNAGDDSAFNPASGRVSVAAAPRRAAPAQDLLFDPEPAVGSTRQVPMPAPISKGLLDDLFDPNAPVASATSSQNQ